MATAAEEAELAVAKMTELTYRTLREACPFLKTAALDKLVGKVANEVEEVLAAEEGAIENSKASKNIFDLSPELRNRIYELAVKHPRGQNHFIRDPSTFPIHLLEHAVPTICQVSQQVRAESLPMYYSSHHFHFHGVVFPREIKVKEVQQWIRTLDKSRTKYIKLVELEVSTMKLNLDQADEDSLVTKRNIMRKLQWEGHGLREDALLLKY